MYQFLPDKNQHLTNWFFQLPCRSQDNEHLNAPEKYHHWLISFWIRKVIDHTKIPWSFLWDNPQGGYSENKERWCIKRTRKPIGIQLFSYFLID